MFIFVGLFIKPLPYVAQAQIGYRTTLINHNVLKIVTKVTDACASSSPMTKKLCSWVGPTAQLAVSRVERLLEGQPASAVKAASVPASSK